MKLVTLRKPLIQVSKWDDESVALVCFVFQLMLGYCVVVIVVATEAGLFVVVYVVKATTN